MSISRAKELITVTMVANCGKMVNWNYVYEHILSAHTAKIVAKILRRRFEKKIEDVLGEDQFGFRRGKELGMQLGC